MFGDVRGCSGMFGDARGCSSMSGMLGDVRGCSGMFGDVRGCLGYCKGTVVTKGMDTNKTLDNY